MKLIIQIPCYNEAHTLAIALASLPRRISGFDSVEWLIVDDGSGDETIKVARRYGVDHIIRHKQNIGLARAFMTGIEACLHLGADIIVNTDADNQYNADDIPQLITPILDRRADMVVGARPIDAMEQFSPTKKLLQKLGSWVVRAASATDISDAPSGFRAMSRDAALRLTVFNEYTYTLETIIQAGLTNIVVMSVPVRVNADLRPSRLVKSIPAYIKRSVLTIIRISVVYRPFRFFGTIGALLFGIGLLLGLRYLFYYATDRGAGHVQSLILASILLGMGFQTVLIAFVSDLMAVNRKLLENIRYMVKRLPTEEETGLDEAAKTDRRKFRVG
jgi:glycosyltransferase involved in cell wall biosynthesis